ncbi:MAG: hypothetical protein ACP5OX_00500 [Minisyncoccia bacterium]
MKKKREVGELRIIGTIPFGSSIWDADFLIFIDGTIGEITKSAQKKGLISYKRKIRNLAAGIRMYLIHILSRYITTLRKIKGIEIKFLGELEELDLWKQKFGSLINELKKEPTKKLDVIINDIELCKEKADKKIEEIKKKDIDIGKWALKKAKILMKEKKRIADILEKFFIEIIGLYDSIKDVAELNALCREFLFGKSYLNLKEVKNLNTIKAHFIDYPQDLEKIRRVEKIVLNLEEKEVRKLRQQIKTLIDLMIPIIEGPLEYRFDGNNYRIEGGNVKCL